MLAKSYNDIRDELIVEAKLSRLNFHILVLKYLEEKISRFTELATKNEDEDD